MVKNIPNNEMYELISEWLEKYHSDCSERKKHKLKTLIVTQMIPVVRQIARTIARRSYDPIEDLVQAGFVGLLKAIDTYSKGKNDNFRIYAGYYIIGEMKHFLRDKLNTIRVPSYIQELNIRINNFTKTLTMEQLRELTSEDVASALHVPSHFVNYAKEVDRRCSTLSLDQIYRPDEDTLSYEELFATNGYEEIKDYTDEKILFRDIIKKLPEEAKMLLDMYYNKDMSQRDISKALGWSEMKVSRKLKKVFLLINKSFMDLKTAQQNEEEV